MGLSKFLLLALAPFEAFLVHTTANAQDVPSLVIAHAPIAFIDSPNPSAVHITVLIHASFLVPDQFRAASLAQFDRPPLLLLSVAPPSILFPTLSFVFLAGHLVL